MMVALLLMRLGTALRCFPPHPLTHAHGGTAADEGQAQLRDRLCAVLKRTFEHRAAAVADVQGQAHKLQMMKIVEAHQQWKCARSTEKYEHRV